MTMPIRFRLALLAAALLCLAPTAALAQWDTPSRAFHKDTAFKLEGKHQAVPCAACHINGVTKGTPQTCVSCHWVRRQDDPYRTALGSQCEQCHRPTSWSAVRWNHSEATGMPLNPAHKALDCAACHKNRVFTGANGQCVTCHRKDYDATTTPNHAAAGFSTQCTECHKASDAAFNQTRFNHNQMFPLVGLHAIQNCATCHVGGRYAGTPRDCVGCHRSNYDRTTSPNHAAAGFSTSCEGCHKPTDTVWKGASGTINHASFYPLVGLHATVDCATCHVGGRYAGTPNTCVGCHRANYDRTVSPNHAAAGYSTDCQGCHKASDSAWKGVSVNHNAFFPLVGVHATVACLTCHTNNRYQGTPNTCIGCHRTDYDRTASPNHAAAGYSTDCQGCHKATDATWKGATINHTQFFPLVGLHATAQCVACHVNNVYKGTPRDCYPCHAAKYQNTTNPNHIAANFPTTCDACHKATDSSWTQGKFTHSWFPITSGKHAGNPCSACHTNPTNYTVFTCLTCHAKAVTDSHHQGRTGYRYDSAACYSCHPTGRAG
jgi:hypothetical protein